MPSSPQAVTFGASAACEAAQSGLEYSELAVAEAALDEIRRLLRPRQRQVLLLLAHGLSNKEIAVQLNLHPRTVAMHIAALKALFGASSRAQSIHKAVELGFFEE